MCFSAEASFIGGATLTAIGTASVLKVSKPSQMFFAAIPLLFGLQQIAEGFLWIAIPNPEYELLKQISTKVFLFFSNILWPIWVPYAIFRLQQNERKRKILLYHTLIGLAVAIFYFVTILLGDVSPQIVGNHIKYGFKPLNAIRIFFFVLYVAATVPPFFIASNKHIRIFGLVMLISLLVSLLFFLQFVTSVWCFFAAIISLYIYWIVSKKKLQNEGM